MARADSSPSYKTSSSSSSSRAHPYGRPHGPRCPWPRLVPAIPKARPVGNTATPHSSTYVLKFSIVLLLVYPILQLVVPYGNSLNEPTSAVCQIHLFNEFNKPITSITSINGFPYMRMWRGSINNKIRIILFSSTTLSFRVTGPIQFYYIEKNVYFYLFFTEYFLLP